jgi:signal transduction histidine kinase
VEITTSLLVVMLGALGIVATIAGGSAVRMARDEAVARLRVGAVYLERAVAAGARLADVGALARVSGPLISGGEFRVVDAWGRELRNGPPSPLPIQGLDALLQQARAHGEAQSAEESVLGEVILVRPISSARGREGFLVGRVDEAQMRERLLPLARAGAWVLLTALLVFGGFGAYMLRRRVVHPLQTLQQATSRIAGGDLSARTSTEGPREVMELAEYFNRMADSLAQQREALVEANLSLTRSEKLATVGRLAAGVAHEVGNPVTAILGFSDVLRRDVSLSERSAKVVEEVKHEALRIQVLVREMLDLSRVDAVELESVNLVDRMREAIERLRAQPLLEGIEVEVQVETVLPCVRADLRRVQQILVNLVENAVHALAKTRDPRISIRFERACLPSNPGRRREDRRTAKPPSEDGVALLVIDNGPGIPEDQLPHVFDPFFTTKAPGEGTGLGLWNAHRLADLMQGRLEVQSAPGRTCFRLVLGRTDRPSGHVESDPDYR